MLQDSIRTWQVAPLPCYMNNLDSLRTWQFACRCAVEVCDFLRNWQAAPNLCCQNKFDFYNFAGCSTAVLGNKVALFRTWQVGMQLCLGMGLIWLELGRYTHSNAAIVSFIRLQFGSLLCSHVAGISLIRLELVRVWLCCRNKSDLCKTWQPALQRYWNETRTIMSSFEPDFQWLNQG